jgi:hypothetical protein
MDTALVEARVATSDAETAAAYGKVAAIYSRDVPSKDGR